MKFLVKGHGLLEIEGLNKVSLGALRLIQYDSPNLTVNAWNGTGFLRVRLADIDLRPPPVVTVLAPVTQELPNYDANGGTPVL